MTKDKKPDWSRGKWKEMLIDQRKFMWRKDTLDMFAKWMKIRQGMTAIDVGCGLGYLGYTYWPYFGKGGRYFGVDNSKGLIKEATKLAKNWARGGKAKFIQADAYNLPFPDNFADWVMCQVVLMHLEEPKRALEEMARVAKPGGLIMCNEPDNLSSMLARPNWSLPEMEVEDELLLKKVDLLCYKGAKKLGRGDLNIGSKVPVMMKQLGLLEVDIRLNDRARFLYPPYDDPIQKNILFMVKKRVLAQKKFWLKRTKEEFLAGGGKPKEFEKAKKIMEKTRATFKKQLKDGTYFACTPGFFYVIKGRKPK